MGGCPRVGVLKGGGREETRGLSELSGSSPARVRVIWCEGRTGCSGTFTRRL